MMHRTHCEARVTPLGNVPRTRVLMDWLDFVLEFWLLISVFQSYCYRLILSSTPSVRIYKQIHQSHLKKKRKKKKKPSLWIYNGWPASFELWHPPDHVFNFHPSFPRNKHTCSQVELRVRLHHVSVVTHPSHAHHGRHGTNILFQFTVWFYWLH